MDKKDEKDLQRTPEEIEQFFGSPLLNWQIAWFKWYEVHSKCGGEFVTFVGRNEYRMGCTCEKED